MLLVSWSAYLIYLSEYTFIRSAYSRYIGIPHSLFGDELVSILSNPAFFLSCLITPLLGKRRALQLMIIGLTYCKFISDYHSIHPLRCPTIVLIMVLSHLFILILTSEGSFKNLSILLNRLVACNLGWLTFLFAKRELAPIWGLQNIGSFNRLEEGMVAAFYLCLITPFYFIHVPQTQNRTFRLKVMIIPLALLSTGWFKWNLSAILMNVIIIFFSFSVILLTESALSSISKLQKHPC